MAEDALLDTAAAESLHAEVGVLREDVTRIVGPIDLRMRMEELEMILASSERRRRTQHELIIQLQEGHAMGLSLLRQKMAADREGRDAEVRKERDELEDDKRRLTKAKSALIDANIAGDRARREAAELGDAILQVEEEVRELRQKLSATEGELVQLTGKEQGLGAERAELEDAVRQASQTLKDLAAGAPGEPDAGPMGGSKNLTPLLAQMEKHIDSLRAQVATKDTEIARLRLVVQQECVTRTGLLRKLRGQQKLAAEAASREYE